MAGTATTNLGKGVAGACRGDVAKRSASEPQPAPKPFDHRTPENKIATEVAKRKGGTVLLDKAGPTGIGISSLVYADAGYDITDDVMKEINKDRPANAPVAPATAAPAAAPASGITVPGLAPKK